MKLQEVIQKAIEGGYRVENIRFNGELLYPNPFSSCGEITIANILLDPLFWQSLGKSLGWESKKWVEMGTVNSVRVEYGKVLKEYEYRWHRFIDHLAAGKTIETYFENL